MAEPLRLVVVSDSDGYLARILRELETKEIPAAAERVASGESMRAALGRGPWDAAVSDLGVPGLDVEDVVRLAREAGPDLPVIVVSGRAGKEDSDRALRAGAAEFIPMEKLQCAACAVERVVRESGVRRERAASAKELKDARDLLASVLSSAPVLLVAVDAGGVITLYTGDGTRVAGRKPGELVGKNVFEFYAGRPELMENFRRALAGEEFRDRIRTLNGAHFEGRFAPVRDERGEVTGAVVVASDVTEKLRAEEMLREKNRQLRSVISNAPVVLLATDAEGTVTLFEGRGTAVFGPGYRDIVGMNVFRDLAGQCPAFAEKIRQALAGSEVSQVVTTATGVHIDSRCRPVRDGEGNVTGAICVGTEVTDRVRAEEALRRSEARYRALVENTNDIVVTFDAGGTITYVSPQVERLGFAAAEVVSRSIFDFVVEEDRERVEADFRRTMATGEEFPTEFRIRDAEGRVLWFEEVGKVQRDEAGRTTGTVSVLRDITDRRRTQEALRTSEERCRRLFEGESDAIVLFDAETRRIEEANPAALELFGYSREEMAALALEELWARRESSLEAVEGVLASDIGMLRVPERLFRKKDGTVFPGEIMLGAFESEGRRMVIKAVRDITERKRAQDELRKARDELERRVEERTAELILANEDLRREVEERRRAEETLRLSEEKFRQFFENEPEYCYMVSPEGLVLDVNGAALEALGYAREELVGKPLGMVYAPESLPRTKELFARWKETGSLRNEEVTVATKASGRRTVLLSAGTVRNSDGRIRFSTSVQRDITERKLAEEQVRSLARFPSENPNPVMRLDRDGTIVYANAASEEVLREWQTEVPGRAPGFWRAAAAEAIDARVEKTLELPCCGRVYQVSIAPVAGADYANLYASDITGLKAAEAALLEAHNSLERRVEERTAQLASANARLELEIEERRAAERSVRESEARYRALVTAETPVIWSTDVEARMVAPQPGWEALTGQTREEYRGHGYRSMFHPDDLEAILANIEASVRVGRMLPLETRIFSKAHGGHRYFRTTAAAVADEGGAPIEWIGMHVDVHDRKLAEAALAEAERRLRDFVEGTDLLVTQVDPDGRFVYVNRTSERIFGCPPERCVGRLAFDFVHPDDRGETEAAFAGWMRDRVQSASLENRQVSSSGEVHHVLWTVNPRYDEAGNVTSIWSVARDITARKLAENALRESELRFRTLFESAPDGMLVIDTETRGIVQANDAFCRKLGRGRDEVEESDMLDFALPERRTDAEEKVDRVRRGETALAEDVAFAASDGSVFYADMNTFWIRLDGRRFLGGILRDITARKEFGEKLRRSEEMYRSLVRSIPDAVTVSDPKGVIRYVSRRRAELHGYESADELLGRNAAELVVAEGRDRLRASFRHALERGAAEGAELVFVRKDGSTFIGEVSFGVTRDAEGRPDSVVTVVRDVTGRKELERRLMESQRLEAVGRLAGGLAHDFNNLLTAIGGFSSRILRKLRPDSPLRADAAQIRKASDMAASLTSQLLAFSRRQMMQPVVLTLNEVLADIEMMLRRLIGEDIELVMRPAPSPGLAMADPGQIGQVIVNLAVNARDAMPRGGVLTIETSDVEFDEPRAEEHPGVPPGAYVTVSMSDTGAGIPPDVLPHIFEPFFTTKERGKGTGLGLSTVYGIVTQSGGHVSVRSEVGKGSTFIVYLPCIGKGHEEEPPPAPGGARDSLRGDETVLLVEDEDVVRDLARLTLADYGYRVLDASDGEEALAIAARHEGPIHLLLADVVMPQMSGREVAEHVVASRPETKVIFMSGYTENVAVRGVGEGDVPLIAKPFTEEDLVRLVRRVLGPPRERAAAN